MPNKVKDKYLALFKRESYFREFLPKNVKNRINFHFKTFDFYKNLPENVSLLKEVNFDILFF